MQQTNRNKPSAGVLNGIKIVIASGAVAGAMGIWSMLAGKALKTPMFRRKVRIIQV